MVITLREAGGSSCSEIDQTVHQSLCGTHVVPTLCGMEVVCVGEGSEPPFFLLILCLSSLVSSFLASILSYNAFILLSLLLASLGTHMPPQGTQNSISHSLLESPIPWHWGMASCQCSLSSVLCPLSVASESGGWRGELEDSWMQASLLGSGEFLTWNSLTCVLATP